MKKIIIFLIAWLVAIFLINKLSVKLIPDRTSYELPYKTPFTFSMAPLLNMDGRRYLDIACNGYSIKDGSLNLRAFFPVYPILVNVFSVGCKINPVLIGISISLISVFLSMVLLWKMLDKKIRSKVVVLLLLFPTSFFFSAFYTESLFLLLSVLVFWFLGKKKIFYAALFAAIASGTRIVGVALTLPVLYEAYLEYKESGRKYFEAVIAPIGLVFYAIYNWITTGSIVTFISSQTYWDRPISILAPFYTIKNQIVSILAGPLSNYDSPFVYSVILIEFFTLLYLLTILIVSYKKIKMSYWLYLAGSAVIILYGGILTSIPRFVLVLFPIQIFLAERLTGFKYYLYMLISFIGFVFLAGLFLRGYWVS